MACIQSSERLGRSGKRCLCTARENAYLDTHGRGRERVMAAYGLWCWRLKIPLVWIERESPRSRFGSVHLDMLSTPNMLTTRGEAAMAGLCASAESNRQTRVSPHDVCYAHVPLSQLADLARAAFRAATTPGNYRPNRTPLPLILGRAAHSHIKLVQSEQEAASA